MTERGVRRYFETELLDHALFLGMSEDVFFYGDPHLLDNYEKAYEKKILADKERMWMQGVYVKSALSSTVLVAALASEENVRNMKDYLEYPNEDKYNTIEKETERAVELLMRQCG